MTVVRVAEGGLVNRLVASSMGKRSRSKFSLALASVRLAHKYSVTGEWWAPASEEKVDRQGMISLVSGSRGNLLEVRRSSRSMVCARGVCAAVASIINCVDGLSNVGSSLPLLELFTSRRVDPRRQKNVKINRIILNLRVSQAKKSGTFFNKSKFF